MLQDDLNEIVSSTLSDVEKLLVRKNSGYNLGGDRLQSFKTAAALQGVMPTQALVGMMSKHTVSVVDLANQKPEMRDFETIEEKIHDSIAYLILLKALMLESISSGESTAQLHERLERLHAKSTMEVSNFTPEASATVITDENRDDVTKRHIEGLKRALEGTA